jgi:hypothetical protein
MTEYIADFVFIVITFNVSDTVIDNMTFSVTVSAIVSDNESVGISEGKKSVPSCELQALSFRYDFLIGFWSRNGQINFPLFFISILVP